MAICCESTEDLGCYGHCDTVETDITITSGVGGTGGAGVYTIMTQEGYFKEFTFGVGEKLNFTNFFNEDKITQFYIINPAGSQITVGTTDCWQVTTTIHTEV